MNVPGNWGFGQPNDQLYFFIFPNKISPDLEPLCIKIVTSPSMHMVLGIPARSWSISDLSRGALLYLP